MTRRSRRARPRRSADDGTTPRIVKPASFPPRVAAFAIDLILVVAVVGFFISTVPWPFSGLLSVTMVTLMFVVGWTTVLSQSFGGSCFQLEVVGSDGDSLSVGRALLRLVVLVGGTLLFFLGPASALSDERRQAWHDKIAGSYVIRRFTTDETLRNLENAMIHRSATREWQPRPIVVTPQKPMPLVVVVLAAAIPSGILYGLVYGLVMLSQLLRRV